MNIIIRYKMYNCTQNLFTNQYDVKLPFLNSNLTYPTTILNRRYI